MDPGIADQMRADWNRRAREDARYYVAFGRRGQDEEEFQATAAPVIRDLERELKWILRDRDARAGRALEIGCGLGRLMRPLSRRFDEIHGVDVSDEMIRLARERLRDVPNAHVHVATGADLADFEDASFDFVYSYAVFQHIPSREVVFRYLEEACRVLRSGGLLRCQLNGLPQTAARYDTWQGVRISAQEIVDFVRARDVQLLALEGVSTQYMWVTMRKAERRPRPDALARASIARITNALTSEPLAPSRGRFAVVSLWIDGLPPECDLLELEALAGTARGTPFYIGPPDCVGLQQINVTLPPGLGTGLRPIALRWAGRPLCAPAMLRVVPPGPSVPRVISVTDAIDLLSGARIVSPFVKVTLEEVDHPEQFQAAIDGAPVTEVEIFCADPVPQRFEINFRIPDSAAPGPHQLEMQLGRRRFAPVALEVAPPPTAEPKPPKRRRASRRSEA